MINDIDLKNYILEKVSSIISSWTDEDIYAISFFVENPNDNPYTPTFSLGYNTEKQYEESVADASDEEEARWNFAFWLQNQEFVFGQEGETKDLIKQWIIAHGFSYCEDYTFDYKDEAAYESNSELLDTILNKFLIVLVEAVKELHKSGAIENKFGKEIPIIIHELEYYDKIAIQNIKANTLPLVQGLVEFCGYFPQ